MAKAYSDALEMVRRHPHSAQAHFALSYVFRYAGMAQEAARECDTALSLDRGDYQLRSCSLVFEQLGQTDRALEFVRLDSGSQWSSRRIPQILLRGGRTREAKEEERNRPWESEGHKMFLACLDHNAEPEWNRLVHQRESRWLADPDPENTYFFGAYMTFCGEKDIGFRLLKSSIQKGYCATSALQSDPFLSKLRGSPEFGQLASAAKACQDRFRAETN